MSGIRYALILTCLMVAGLKGSLADVVRAPAPDAWDKVGEVSVLQLVQGNVLHRNYPDALTSLLAEINRKTTLKVAPDPIFIETFEDPRVLEHTFIYVNFADRRDWTLSPAEADNLRDFLNRGGFLFLDAGINAAFLREDNAAHGQYHSFAEWEVSPDARAMMKQVFPERSFQPLPRDHEVFRAFYTGLPDASVLPDTVRSYVVNEKWPQGTYAAMGVHVEGRLAVLAMPILAMGWGKNELDQWTTFIGFRVREGADGLSERLSEAAYSGVRFETTREDGRKDIVYTQQAAMPAWVQEPDNNWRVFRYYYTQEISDYAHTFYTRLGINVFMYAYTH